MLKDFSIRIISKMLVISSPLLFLASCEYDLEHTNPLDPFGYADLIVINPKVTPQTVNRGGVVSVSCTVKNTGGITADFPITQFDGLYYYLSADNQYSSSDLELGTSNVDDLSAGGQQNVGENLTIPGNTVPGIYYVLFYIDKEGDIIEFNENDNVGSYQINVTQ